MLPKTWQTDEAACAKAAELEQRFKIRCMVVDNPFGVVVMRSERPYTLFMFPLPDEDPESASFQLRSEACAAECYEHMVVTTWDFRVTLGMIDWSPWFNRFLTDPMSFPLKEMATGANLIGRVIYGQELMHEAHRQARIVFNDPEIIRKWREEAYQRREQQKKRGVIRTLKELPRLLNAYDRVDIEEFLSNVARRVANEPIAYVVGIERSGRPVAQAAEWFVPDCPPVKYLDVHWLRDMERTPENLAIAAATLEEEFPEIHTALCANPRSVLFVEDRVALGRTVKCLNDLICHLAGQKEASHMMTLSTETSSWWYRKDVLGVRLARGTSFRARVSPTKKSAWFYAKLRRIVEEIKSAD